MSYVYTSHWSPMKTYFFDIDGTLLTHLDSLEKGLETDFIKPLPGVREKISDLHCDGHTIIITTARCESMRPLTIKQLENAGIVYDQLIMGITSGSRVLVNDYVSEGKPTAYAHNVLRNVDGLMNLE